MSVKLISSDNEDFTVDKAVAERSVLIKNMLEGKCHGTTRKEMLGGGVCVCSWQDSNRSPLTRCG